MLITNHTVRDGLLLAGPLTLMILAGWFCYRIYILSGCHATIREDCSLVNNVSSGLLSVEKQRDSFMRIAEQQIEQFELNPAQHDTLKFEIEQMLHKLTR